jgi:hypothetical protein
MKNVIEEGEMALEPKSEPISSHDGIEGAESGPYGKDSQELPVNMKQVW